MLAGVGSSRRHCAVFRRRPRTVENVLERGGEQHEGEGDPDKEASRGSEAGCTCDCGVFRGHPNITSATGGGREKAKKKIPGRRRNPRIFQPRIKVLRNGTSVYVKNERQWAKCAALAAIAAVCTKRSRWERRNAMRTERRTKKGIDHATGPHLFFLNSMAKRGQGVCRAERGAEGCERDSKPTVPCAKEPRALLCRLSGSSYAKSHLDARTRHPSLCGRQGRSSWQLFGVADMPALFGRAKRRVDAIRVVDGLDGTQPGHLRDTEPGEKETGRLRSAESRLSGSSRLLVTRDRQPG